MFVEWRASATNVYSVKSSLVDFVDVDLFCLRVAFDDGISACCLFAKSHVMNCVTNITWRTASGARLGGFAYEYDAVGRIVLRSHAIGSNAFDRVYAYDDLDRLSSDGGVTYTYDAAGNRMTRTENGETITYTLGIGDRLASYGRAGTPRAPQSAEGAYTHDAAGNVTRIERDGRPTLDLTWNSQYQLVSVATNGVFAEGYAYDARGCVVLAGFQVLETLQRAAESYTRARGKRQKALTAGQTNRLMTLLRSLVLIEIDLGSIYMEARMVLVAAGRTILHGRNLKTWQENIRKVEGGRYA